MKTKIREVNVADVRRAKLAEIPTDTLKTFLEFYKNPPYQPTAEQADRLKAQQIEVEDEIRRRTAN